MKNKKSFRKEVIDGKETLVGYYDLKEMSGEEIEKDFLAEEKMHNKNKTYVSYDIDKDYLYVFYKKTNEVNPVQCNAVEVENYKNCYEIKTKENNEFVGYAFKNFFTNKIDDIIESFPFKDRDYQRDILPEILYRFEQYEQEDEE